MTKIMTDGSTTVAPSVEIYVRFSLIIGNNPLHTGHEIHPSVSMCTCI